MFRSNVFYSHFHLPDNDDPRIRSTSNKNRKKKLDKRMKLILPLKEWPTAYHF